MNNSNNVLTRAIDLLGKIQFGEASEIRSELQVMKLQSLHKQELLKLRLQVMKAAHKHAAKACEACEELELADEALEVVTLLNVALAEARDELNAQ